MAQFVCGWVVGFVLLFLTTFFSRVPKNILGSIIIASVASLVEYEQAIYLWKVTETKWGKPLDRRLLYMSFFTAFR